MNLDTITLDDLAAATPVNHWGYRERDLTTPVHDVVGYDRDARKDRDAAYTLQLAWAKAAGRNPNNHVVVEVRLVDGTLVHVKLSDNNLRVAARSVEVPERYR